MYLHVKRRYHISFITRAKVAYKIFDTKSCSQSVNYRPGFWDGEVNPFTSDQWNQDGSLPAPSCAHAHFSHTQAFILRARLKHSADLICPRTRPTKPPFGWQRSNNNRVRDESAKENEDCLNEIASQLAKGSGSGKIPKKSTKSAETERTDYCSLLAQLAPTMDQSGDHD